MSRSRNFPYHPDDAPADIAAAFGTPPEVCRQIASDRRKAELFDRMPIIAQAIPDRETLLRVLAALQVQP